MKVEKDAISDAEPTSACDVLDPLLSFQVFLTRKVGQQKRRPRNWEDERSY
jgi:hypothetical protein